MRFSDYKLICSMVYRRQATRALNHCIDRTLRRHLGHSSSPEQTLEHKAKVLCLGLENNQLMAVLISLQRNVSIKQRITAITTQ